MCRCLNTASWLSLRWSTGFSYWSLWRILKPFMPPTQRFFVCCGGGGWGEYIGFTLSVHPSVRLPVRPARCVFSITPTGWILSILGIQMVTTKRGCVTHNDLWLWPISTSCCISYTAHAVLDGIFLYLALMISSIRGCVAHNDFWSRPTSSRLFSCDFAVEVRGMLVDFFI